ncbi:MAG: XRE family transcriptional regulator [Burkholderiales bacterium]|nr:XRE family transcriptional regulator [Burkholderiales bacterium]
MEQFSKIGKIIKILLEECNLDEASLSRHVCIPKSTLSRLINHDANPTLETIKPIAEFFGLTVSQLIGETAIPSDRLPGTCFPNPYTVSRVPILNFLNIDTYLNDTISNFEWVSTEKELTEKSFAIFIENDEFNLFIPKNSLVIININSLPEYGDIVLAKLKKTNTLTLRQFMVDDGDCYFRTLNPNINKVSKVSKEDTIYGVIIEHRLNYISNVNFESKNSKGIAFAKNFKLVFGF